MHRDYSGLSRPRAPQRAQEHTPQRGATVSTEREAAQLFFCFNLRTNIFPTTLQLREESAEYDQCLCVSVMLNNKCALTFGGFSNKAASPGEVEV